MTDDMSLLFMLFLQTRLARSFEITMYLFDLVSLDRFAPRIWTLYINIYDPAAFLAEQVMVRSLGEFIPDFGSGDGDRGNEIGFRK